MNRIENYKKRQISWMALALILLFVLAAFLLVQTLTSFKPRAEAIIADQKNLQARLARMDEELTEISEAVESWPGVIYVIPDTPIPSLADPEGGTNNG